MKGKVIGIDFLNTDEEGGMYALFESNDGGDSWTIIENGRQIEGLLNHAKQKYDENIPMILPFHVREMLECEIIEQQREKRKRLKLTKPNLTASWWKKLLDRFRR